MKVKCGLNGANVFRGKFVVKVSSQPLEFRKWITRTKLFCLLHKRGVKTKRIQVNRLRKKLPNKNKLLLNWDYESSKLFTFPNGFFAQVLMMKITFFLFHQILLLCMNWVLRLFKKSFFSKFMKSSRNSKWFCFSADQAVWEIKINLAPMMCENLRCEVNSIWMINTAIRERMKNAVVVSVGWKKK